MSSQAGSSAGPPASVRQRVWSLCLWRGARVSQAVDQTASTTLETRRRAPPTERSRALHLESATESDLPLRNRSSPIWERTLTLTRRPRSLSRSGQPVTCPLALCSKRAIAAIGLVRARARAYVADRGALDGYGSNRGAAGAAPLRARPKAQAGRLGHHCYYCRGGCARGGTGVDVLGVVFVCCLPLIEL